MTAFSNFIVTRNFTLYLLFLSVTLTLNLLFLSLIIYSYSLSTLSLFTLTLNLLSLFNLFLLLSTLSFLLFICSFSLTLYLLFISLLLLFTLLLTLCFLILYMIVFPGKLYNELGLMYYKSATCFEMALPLNRPPQGDKCWEAIIIQNLGAVYNSLADYPRAVPFHEQAPALHGEYCGLDDIFIVELFYQRTSGGLWIIPWGII